MIIQKKEVKDSVPFGTLEAGDVFKNEDGCFLMKIKTYEYCGHNAVYLEGGSLTSFLNNTIIVRVQGKFMEESIEDKSK